MASEKRRTFLTERREREGGGEGRSFEKWVPFFRSPKTRSALKGCRCPKGASRGVEEDMSRLTWRLDGIRDYEELLDEEGEPDRTTLFVIYLTRNIGMPSLTKKNIEKAHRRAVAHAQVFGGPITEIPDAKTVDAVREGEKDYEALFPVSRTLTMEELRRHIGLRTSARRVRRDTFNRRMKEALLEKMERMEPIYADDVDTGMGGKMSTLGGPEKGANP